MANQEINKPIFPEDRIINHARLERWLDKHVSTLKEPESIGMVKSPYEPEQQESLTIDSLEAVCTQALINDIGAHPVCTEVNAATILALIGRLKRAEVEVRKVKNLLGRSPGKSVLDQDVDEMYKQGFIDGKEFQIDQNRGACLPLAWLIVDEMNRKTGLTFQKPNGLPNKHCHVQALYSRGDSV